MCRVCDGEGCLNCNPNPDNVCTKCGNPDCDTLECRKPYFRNLARKVVNGSEFVLQLQLVEADDHYGIKEHYDYVIAGPNWLSGRLKAQGINEREIFEYWDEVSYEDVKDDWAAFYERGIIGG